MNRTSGRFRIGALLFTATIIAHQASAQTFQAGGPLAATSENGQHVPMSYNVKVYGSYNFAESCTFDPNRNLILAMNAGAPQDQAPNDGY